jgi:broad specificity phosphatase PhoE
MTNEELITHGAESEEQMIERAKELLSYVQSLDQRSVLLVSHNQFRKQLQAYLMEVSFSDMTNMPNCHLLDLSELVEAKQHEMSDNLLQG